MSSTGTEKTPAGIDPRGPRFGASITSVLLLITVFLAIDPLTFKAAFALLGLITFLFAVGALYGTAKHPYGWIFKNLVRPRLQPPTELEDPRPPRFAQTVGLIVAGTGLVLGLFEVPYGLAIAASAAFVAAFLNAVFAYCLGCQIYLGLQRIGIIRH
jgi:hypothetical protein